MGRGRGRRRRHRRHGIPVYITYPGPGYYVGPYVDPYYYQEPIPVVHGVTSRIRNGRGILGLVGSGFSQIPGDSMEILYEIAGITAGVSRARVPISKRSDSEIEFVLPVERMHLAQLRITDIGYFAGDSVVGLGSQIFSRYSFPLTPFNRAARRYSAREDSPREPQGASIREASLPPAQISEHPADRPGKPGIVYQTGYGSMMAGGPAPTAPVKMEIGRMEHTMPPNRMLEPHRMGEQQRQLWHQTGRRFGVPGIPAGQPGWAGAGGVAQAPHPMRGMRPVADPTFGPGLSAGQGGVQALPPGRGPIAVQTYGSLGYGSMGDGSMDMASRGGQRRYAGSKKGSKKGIKRAARRRRRR